MLWFRSSPDPDIFQMFLSKFLPLAINSRFIQSYDFNKKLQSISGLLTFYRSNILLWLVSCLNKDYSSPLLHIIC